jgi:outer membrane protein, heavy metal efflux system
MACRVLYVAPARFAVTFLLLAGAGFPKSAHAAVSWQEAVGRLADHPRLRAAHWRVEAARAEAAIVGEVPNPSLGATLGRGTGTESHKSGLEWAGTLSVPFEWLPARAPRLAAASAELDAALQEEAETELLVREQLRGLFWYLAYDRARLGELAQSLAEARELARLVRRRVERGETRAIEATRVEAEAERVDIELGEAQAEAASHQSELALWLGEPLDAALEVSADLGALPPLPSLPETLAASAEHPLVRAALAHLGAGQAASVAERRARVPAFDLGAYAGRDLERLAYGGSLALRLPVWNWNSGAVARADARQAEARELADDAARNAKAAVVAAYYSCSQRRQTVEHYREAILTDAEQSVTALEKAFKSGETSLLDVLDARRLRGSVRRDYLAAQLQAQLDCRRLASLAGKPEP